MLVTMTTLFLVMNIPNYFIRIYNSLFSCKDDECASVSEPHIVIEVVKEMFAFH